MNREQLNEIAGMTSPVRCLRCHVGVYDLGKVTVTARYVDCSMWKTPCCNVVVDDRGETGWKSIKDYERIDKDNPHGGRPTIDGIFWGLA